jgi:hypothetical protein
MSPLDYLQNTDLQSIVALGVDGDNIPIEAIPKPMLRRERSSSCDINMIIRTNQIKPETFCYPSEINFDETLISQEVITSIDFILV